MRGVWKYLVLFCVLIPVFKALNSNEILIIVSYDAFRNEYFDRGVTNFTNELRYNSTRSKYLRNIFPTKTFPNHHSIATGVYADDHGVTGNEFYDSDLQKSFNYSYEMFHYRAEILPIWILNEIAGGHSGCMMWPGSDYVYNGISCTYKQHFNMSENMNDRVDQVMGWVINKTHPANLVMLYIEDPDNHAHAFGPESQKITDLVAKLDKMTEYLYKKIQENNLQNRVNVIHLSDHGMDSMTLQNVIDLRKIIKHKVSYYGTTPVLQIVPEHASETDEIYKELKKASEATKNFKVYLNNEFPDRWHFHNKYRVGPITVVAEIKYGFQDMIDAANWYEKAFNITVKPTNKYGVHGYDNAIESMHPMFFAYGNRIKSFNEVEPFDTVDLFYLFCEILDLPLPDYLKGNREHVLRILKSDDISRKTSRWIVLSASVILSSIIVSTLMITMKLLRRNRSNIPSYLYEEDTTVLDDTKIHNPTSIPPTQSTPLATSSTRFNAF